MTDSATVRAWWAGYQCATARYVRVTFPGLNRTWSLLVADKSKPIWQAVATIMAEEQYLFLESAGGTYNCRPPSLHAYALALDLNPSKNPFRCPLKTNMPHEFVRRMKSIRANGKPALVWGGDWPCSNPPDPMHWQLAVKPDDCHHVTYDGQVANPMRLPLRLGDVGEDVKYLQTKLIVLGFLPRTTPPANTGTYDAATSKAVLDMRKSVGSGATSGDVYASDAAQQLDTAWSQHYATGEQGPPGPPGPPGSLTIRGDVTLP